MVKAYLRYDLVNTWGVITSNSNLTYDYTGKLLITASLENVSIWNVKLATTVSTLIPPISQSGKVAGEVTALAASPVSSQIAVGHADGTIRLWNIETGDCECTFNGHRTAVTALRFSPSGATLASGARDTEVVLWDVAAESGLFRLRGHTGQITDLAFLGGSGSGRLVSSSKDETIRVWDLDTQHCCQTVVSHGGEAWSLDINPAGTRLAVGSVDVDLRVFAVDADSADPTGVLTAMGSVRRSTTERAATVRYIEQANGTVLLMCQAAGKVTEMWKIRSESEAAKRLKRRKKRRKEKQQQKEKNQSEDAAPWDQEGDDEEDKNDDNGDELAASDELQSLAVIRCKHKVRSATFCPSSSSSSSSSTKARLVLSLANNSLEVWDIPTSASTPETTIEPSRTAVVDATGHRSDVRAITLSNDDALCASTSNDSLKVWNPKTGSCIRTMDSGYGLCAMFAPGNKHVIVGTKEGKLEIFDIAASELVTSIDAHQGSVWSICALPDDSGFVTGGADKEVKFWEWDLSLGAGSGSGSTSSTLSADVTRTLTMTDDVLNVRISPDGRLLAVALLDSTIRVFFTDSLKFFLSLYGHKLPVLSMSISSDSTLLVSGSADKNIKIWGLDFGDCHRSLFAHGDSVTQVAFVPNTHYVFTSGKDKVVKYWDADKFEHLLTLEGHQGEIWGLAVSSLGDFFITAGHDRSLRRWERTDEPFFVEEERERRLESLFEADLENSDRRPLHEELQGDTNTNTSAAPAGRKTLETVAAADALVDALDLATEEEERLVEVEKAGKDPKAHGGANPLLLGMTPDVYVLHAVSRVRGSELEQALLLLPFNDALKLLGYLLVWLNRGSTKPELLCRVAALLVRLHLQQLTSTPSARPLLTQLQGLLRQRVQELKDVVGYNVAAMQHVQREMNEAKGKSRADTGIAVLPLKRKAALAANTLGASE